MNVTALDLGGFPGVARAHMVATQVAARWLASMPAEWQVDVPPLGGASVTTAGVAPVPDDAIPLAIRRDGLSGRLCVPAALAVRWVDRAISGRELFAPVRALGPAERGVLLAVLAPVLDRIGWSFALGAAPDLDAAGIVLRIAAAAGTGPVWLQAPAPAPQPRPDGTSPFAARAVGLPIEVAVRVAATAVPANALAGLELGDVVLFDRVAAGGLTSAQTADVQLAVGAFRAPARLDGDGGLTVGQGWRRAAAPAAETSENGKDVTMDAEKTDAPAATLAAAPIEVVAELGRITLRGEEILGLAPGVVLGLRVDRSNAVSLRVGGQVWAEGELVNVEGELGVRVTRLVPR